MWGADGPQEVDMQGNKVAPKKYEERKMNVHDSSLEDNDRESPVALLSSMNLNDETLNGNIIPIESGSHGSSQIKPKSNDLNSNLLKNIFGETKKPKKATVIENEDTTAELDKEEGELVNSTDK